MNIESLKKRLFDTTVNKLTSVVRKINHIIETYNNNKCPECNNGLVFSGKGDDMCCRTCEQDFSLAIYMGIIDIALDQL